MIATHTTRTQPRGRWLSAGVLLTTSFVLLGSSELRSTPRLTQTAEEKDAAVREVREASDGFHRVMEARAIPADVLRDAEAVGVFPSVVRAAFLIGGQGGGGTITRRTESGWSAPIFFKLSGASVGAQIGGTKTDLVFVFTSKASVDALLKDRFQIGSDVVAVAGRDEARVPDANASMREQILVYSRHQGLFAGVAVNGAVLTPHNGLNRATYGLTAKEILSGIAPSHIPSELRELGDVLSTFNRTSS